MCNPIAFVTFSENPVFSRFEIGFCEADFFVHNLNTLFIDIFKSYCK